MNVPFANLPEQYLAIEKDLQHSWSEIIANGSFILGAHVTAFETAFAEYCEVKHAIGVGSGTDALTLALRALGIGPGDEVITVANSFIATAEAIVHAGAVPMFVDMDPETFNIDVNQIAAALTRRTKAIIPVHLYGQPAPMAAILEIAKQRGLFVIEDAAQAHGACYRGRKVGSLGHAACFSFYPGKNLGAYGDAGAVVTNDDDVALAVRKLRDHGGTSKYQHDVLGCNSRLDALQAAVLSAKLKHLDRWNLARQHRAASYNHLLADVPAVSTPKTAADSSHVFHLYVVQIEGDNRDALQHFLLQRGIQTLIHYPQPITATAPFAELRGAATPHAADAARKILSLPLYPELRMPQLEYVSESITVYMNRIAPNRANC
jgi:dTDP-4-amino-4,6-dideoxygalactose transaminase